MAGRRIRGISRGWKESILVLRSGRGASNPRIVFSQDGSRIAVLLDVGVPPWYAPLYSLVGRKAPEMRVMQLWIGKPNGSGLRLVAAEEAQALRKAGLYPMYLRWEPDGR